jgi:uncharacterized protein (DUF433 family)
MENKTFDTITAQLETLQKQLMDVQVKLEKMTGVYSTPVFKTDHPHIVRVQGVQGGDPIVHGTGRTVRGVAELSRQMSLEELAQEYEGSLTLAQLFDALSYYYDHQGEIDQYTAENRAAMERFEHPDHAYVMKHSGINNGEPSLRNSKITVREIIERTRAGESVDEIVQTTKFVNQAQVYDALSYYYDHAEEIEVYIRANKDTSWQAMHPAST